MKALSILSVSVLALGLACGPTLADSTAGAGPTDSTAGTVATPGTSPNGVLSGQAAGRGDANQTTATDLGTPGSAKFKAACADAIANPDRHQDILAMCKNANQ